MKKEEFLQNFFADSSFTEEKLKQDLSLRHYSRITHKNQNFILMSSAYPKAEKFLEFIKISKILTDFGLKTPKIYSHNIENGLILEEDLGSDIFNLHLKYQPNKEEDLYLQATNILKTLYNIKFTPQYNLPTHTDEIFLQGVQQFNIYFKLSQSDATYLLNFFQDKLSELKPTRKNFSLQDFHADNLIITKDQQIALLDYQDAMWSFRGYDLVSFLFDARRYVSPSLRKKLLQNFYHNLDNQENFLNEFYLIALQHNLRVSSLFVKVAQERGLTKYQKYLPNCYKYLIEILQNIDELKISKIVKNSLLI